jgi:PIN domain nuclease of toxin-antitoxin system
LGSDVRASLRSEAEEIRVSAATAWEISIKRQFGKLRAPDDLEEQLRVGGLQPLAITIRHAQLAGQLPLHHSDPFDRMLIAQASLERLTIVTHDPRFEQYGVPVFAV